MGALERIGPPPPPPAVMAVLGRFSRQELGSATEVLVSLLDLWDGESEAEEDDPLEANGDERDGSGGEDDSCEHKVRRSLGGAGCPVSDPDEAVDEKGCDDINDDREDEPEHFPRYGEDQSKGPIGPYCALSD